MYPNFWYFVIWPLFCNFRALCNMPGVVEPTEKQTLSNVVILKLVYTMYIQRAAARSFCFFKDKQHRSLSKIFRGNRKEGEKLEYDVKKKNNWTLVFNDINKIFSILEKYNKRPRLTNLYDIFTCYWILQVLFCSYISICLEILESRSRIYLNIYLSYKYLIDHR